MYYQITHQRIQSDKMKQFMRYTFTLFSISCIILKEQSVQSFNLNSRTRMTDTTSSSTFHRKSCGPNCNKFSIEQYNASSEIVPLTISGGSKDDADDIAKNKPTLLREMIAEFVGTYIIVQIGCGTVCAAIFKSAQVGLWQIAAVWSIAVTLAISATASISGAHLNPAITIALASVRDFPWKKVGPFMIAQLLGAIVAGGVNFTLYHDSIAQFEAANNIVRGTVESIKSASAFGEYWSMSSWAGAFFAEAYGTAVLAFMIFSLTNPKNETTSKNSFMVPPLIGATVGALISFIAPLTQAGFNPARDFGPRIVSLLAGWGSIAMKGWWVYVFAPIIGAVIGGKLADKMFSN